MNTHRLIGFMLTGVLALQATAVTAAVQDNDNRDACCLASEYKLQEAAPAAPARPPATTGKANGQVTLGDVACCVGAEWKLDTQAVSAPVAVVAPQHVHKAQPESDDSFCCIASEWSAR